MTYEEALTIAIAAVKGKFWEHSYVFKLDDGTWTAQAYPKKEDEGPPNLAKQISLEMYPELKGYPYENSS